MSKYKARVYYQDSVPDEHRWYGNVVWSDFWFCREFAQRDIDNFLHDNSHTPYRVQITGGNMRARTLQEQEGMAKFGSLLLPDYPIDVDDHSIWFDSIEGMNGYQKYPIKHVYSLMLFYIKYLSIQMKDRVDFERVCKSLIKRKHQCFHGIPDQQVGTALFWFAKVKYPEEVTQFYSYLNRGNGPGTSMRFLAELEEEEVDKPKAAGEFYYAVLDEWCSLFRKELRYTIDHHSKNYARVYYMPLILQDVYERVYAGDGYFDGFDYGDDEW
jgi:hypothetical protein